MMRAIRLCALLACFYPTLALVDPGAASVDEAGGLPTGYRLVWSDEFDSGRAPDPARWDYDTARNREGWYNNELQYYAAARTKNARVERGTLVIEAHRERLDRRRFPDWGGQRYSSAKLITQGKASWTYGFFEVRAKLACGRGAWPAIWMLAAHPRDGWPHDGDIDILEHVGAAPGIVHATIHTGAYNQTIGTQRTADQPLPDACSAFHRYQLLWTHDRIAIGIDDRFHFQFARDPAGGRTAWPFDEPQYLILNLAIGGTTPWGENAVDDAILPTRMEVDYVRIYQRRDDPRRAER